MTKKLLAVCAVAGLTIFLGVTTAAHDEKKGHKPGEKIERSLSVDPEATVTLCVASGTLRVRGWDKNEIRVTSLDAAQIDFRRIDKAKDSATPATRVDVMVFDKHSPAKPKLDCQALADVDMQVPVGATVQVQTRDGDIGIAGVSAVYAGSQNGDIMIERAVKLVEAGSVGGSISLKDSSGRINLSSAGGGVEVVNIRSSSDEDTLEVGTVSGDIQLERVSNTSVTVKTVNGRVTMSGPLAKSGNYGFTNMAGDVVLAMPHDASFHLTAKVSEKHDIISDFKLTYLSEAPPQPAPKPRSPGNTPGASEAPEISVKAPLKTPDTPKPASKVTPLPKTGPVVGPIMIERPTIVVPYALRRVSVVCGSGDATISVASFGGTIRLKKI